MLKKGAVISYPDADVMAFKHSLEQKEVLVIVNVRNHVVAFDVAAELENTVWKNAFDSSEVTLPVSINLQAYEYLVLTK